MSLIDSIDSIVQTNHESERKVTQKRRIFYAKGLDSSTDSSDKRRMGNNDNGSENCEKSTVSKSIDVGIPRQEF